jgi:hypothetical protein
VHAKGCSFNDKHYFCGENILKIITLTPQKKKFEFSETKRAFGSLERADVYICGLKLFEKSSLHACMQATLLFSHSYVHVHERSLNSHARCNKDSANPKNKGGKRIVFVICNMKSLYVFFICNLYALYVIFFICNKVCKRIIFVIM